MAQESERHVQAVLSALKILEAFDKDRPLRLKDLHERTGLNRSRILRFAGTLQAAGFLEYDEGAGTYTLGLKLYSLGSLLGQRVSDMADFVRPALKRLAAQSGNTAFYSIRHGFDRLVIAKEESSEGLRFIVEEGSRRPLLFGATGKVLLAHAPDEVREHVFEQPVLARGVGGEGVDKGAMMDELARIREKAFAISRGEATAHGFAVAVAVPVNRAGSIQYDALTIAGPLAKLTDQLAAGYVDMLGKEMQGLSTKLANFSPPMPVF
ncbi:IclR family transcriptional regulator [Arsenicitalea aurantiaca]|uniref:IclR family transcriptional regulator n=1 Tax=Arsenicitalea aurantiaca TaxID=1783274 RepID=A0A433X7Q2_9HYPH|nr:IclR family transcriptional regulator [Arsenicitalea aurantiaca]RUT30085.1 IclR family transcriptional regulator [Arsenicitalea aurantiaca]